MGKVNFQLRSYVDKTGKSLIYACYTHAGEKLRISTLLKVDCKYWDKEHQRLKKGAPNFAQIEGALQKLKSQINNFYFKCIYNGESPDVRNLQQLLNQDQAKLKDFFDLYEQFIEDMKNQICFKRCKDYITVKNKLQLFQKERKTGITLNSIDYKFLIDFQNYLTNHYQLNWNSVVKYIKILKRFLNYCRKLKLLSNLDYQDFSVSEKEPEIIALTREELLKIISADLKNNKLQRVRDIFLFQVFTGQRYGDVKKIRKDDIRDDHWHLLTQKTNQPNVVPLIPPAYEILKRYDFSLPEISTQKQNDYLKELGRIAGITSVVNKYKWIGSKRIDNYVRKCDILSTHVAKRTFVTLSQENGLSDKLVMKITGNSPKTIKRYEKLSKEYKLTEATKAWKLVINSTPEKKVSSS